VADNPIAKIDIEIDRCDKRIKALRSQIDGEMQRRERLGISRETLIEMGYEAKRHVEIDGRVQSDAHNPDAPKTTKQLIEHVASMGALWRTANELQEEMSEIAGREVPMSTVSPSLTEMKKAGRIVRDGMRVALRSRVLTEEPDLLNENDPPSEGGSDADEVSASSDENPSVDSAQLKGGADGLASHPVVTG
jgi:hypothetical protein